MGIFYYFMKYNLLEIVKYTGINMSSCNTRNIVTVYIYFFPSEFLPSTAAYLTWHFALVCFPSAFFSWVNDSTAHSLSLTNNVICRKSQNVCHVCHLYFFQEWAETDKQRDKQWLVPVSLKLSKMFRGEKHSGKEN